MDEVLLRLRTAVADRYAVEREAGSGAMSVVYLADDLRHHRKVALKVLRPDLAATLGAQRFLREIAIEAQLNHPHILPLHDSGEAGGFVFYVMPFVEGESLRDRMVREGPLPVADVIWVLRDMADALACAHEHGVVHRDIKPDNVMLSGRHAVVADFGIAKAVRNSGVASSDGALTTAGISLGTPRYMAPEQCLADPAIDLRADIYALGIVAFEMLTGRAPFVGSNPQELVAAHLTQRPPAIRDLRHDVPPTLAAIVARCLEKRPEDRYQSADQFLSALAPLLAPPVPPTVRRRRIAIATVGAVLLLAAAGWTAISVRQGRRMQWVRAVAIPRIAALVDSGDNDGAFTLAQQARAIAPDDSTLAMLWPRVSHTVVVRTDPTGARVFRRSISGPDSAWQPLGVTPTDSVAVPPGAWHLRLEREGFEPLEALVSLHFMDDGWSYALVPTGGPLAGMVRMPARRFEYLWLPGMERVKAFSLDTFWIDKFEVTNRQYKRFVESGGYRQRDWWDEPFELDGRPMRWETAMARFTDRTGRSGPATWEAGSYPEGEAEYPVAGVSWYEAAAYAKFAGKSLPTIYHWTRAARPWDATWMVAFSNFSHRSAAPVGSYRSIGAFGTRDMAGNVREWCRNASGATRYIMGGGWNDQDYDFNHPVTQPPFDRSSGNGIRLVRYRASDSTLVKLSGPVSRAYPDYARARPVADDIYQVYKRLYDYDPAPLDARVEARDERVAEYVHETVTFNAAYGNERMIGHLFLPRRGRAPYQTIVFFPGSGALLTRTFSLNMFRAQIDYIVKSGRAVMYPVYQSTYERGDGFTIAVPSPTSAYRDHTIMWVKDFRRTVDYLTTRADVDPARIAYFGFSWGGIMGGIIPALEPRLRAQVLYVAGLPYQRGQSEVDPVNFLPRVTLPTLMMNGTYDSYFPLETSQLPFMRLLGTPPEHKRHRFEPGVHFVPRNVMIAETLAWFDKYLGPVD